MRERIYFVLLTCLLLGIEIFIALFVHDSFVRPYLGDVLVVVLIYTFIRILILKKCPLLVLWVFLFAAGVEVLQYFKIVELLGFQDSTVMSVLLGSVFDIKDIVCYGVGCIIVGSCEVMVRRNRKKPRDFFRECRKYCKLFVM
ncbi:MAG: DUF2809 domain-containing protein [Lachnospiraceae bacterium]|nr:DUF2809 domain-containing protein [Lachnospiraceae bacterium]